MEVKQLSAKRGRVGGIGRTGLGGTKNDSNFIIFLINSKFYPNYFQMKPDFTPNLPQKNREGFVWNPSLTAR